MYNLERMYMRPDLLGPKETMLEKYPELGAFNEFLECTDEMIRIVVLVGDIDSPFIRMKDRESMISAVFEYLNIDKKTNQSMFQKIVAYRHPIFMGAWVRYLQILHETEFTNWLLTKRDYEFFISQTNSTQDDRESDLNYFKKRNEARNRVKELGDEMRRIEAKLFPDSKAAREAALAESRMKIRLYAEQYAEPFNFY